MLPKRPYHFSDNWIKKDKRALSKQRSIFVNVSQKKKNNMHSKCLYKNIFGSHSPAINTSFRRERGPHLHKHPACSDHLVAPSYVGVCAQNLLLAYFHWRWKRVLKTSRVSLIFNKSAVLRQLQICLCSCKSTRAGIQHQLWCLQKLATSVIHSTTSAPASAASFFRSLGWPLKESFFWRHTKIIVHHISPTQVVSSNSLVASVFAWQSSTYCDAPDRQKQMAISTTDVGAARFTAVVYW